MQLKPGQEFERYVVESVLGEGSTSVVYRVRHVHLGAGYAFKLLHRQSKAIRKRLMLEGQIQAKIEHPNIVRVVDVIEVNGQTGLLMEFVRGPALDRLLLQIQPSQEEALAIFGGILAGMTMAHDRGLIHRDLKPENILLRPTERGLFPMVTDFGLAKSEKEGPKSRPGQLMGTPAYMAPEQAADAEAVGAKADVFALGCILYELVTGQVAFQGETVDEILENVLAGRYTPPEEVCPGLAASTVAAIHGCLKLNPAERLPDCRAIAAVLAETNSVAEVGDVLPNNVPNNTQTSAVARSLAWANTPAPAQPRAVSRLKTPEPAEPEDGAPRRTRRKRLVPRKRSGAAAGTKAEPTPEAGTEATPENAVEPSAGDASGVVPPGDGDGAAAGKKTRSLGYTSIVPFDEEDDEPSSSNNLSLEELRNQANAWLTMPPVDAEDPPSGASGDVSKLDPAPGAASPSGGGPKNYSIPPPQEIEEPSSPTAEVPAESPLRTPAASEQPTPSERPAAARRPAAVPAAEVASPAEPAPAAASAEDAKSNRTMVMVVGGGLVALVVALALAGGGLALVLADGEALEAAQVVEVTPDEPPVIEPDTEVAPETDVVDEELEEPVDEGSDSATEAPDVGLRTTSKTARHATGQEPVALPPPPPPPPPPPAQIAHAAPNVAARGFLNVVGNGGQVYLMREGKRYAVDAALPVGTYKVYADFDSGSPVEAGTVAIIEGETTKIRCRSAKKSCS